VIQFVDETQQQRTMRRLTACLHTLYSIAEELDDPENVEDRGDLLIAAENLLDAALCITDDIRGIVWQYSQTPAEIAAEENDTDI
jgi:hypothetical protein